MATPAPYEDPKVIGTPAWWIARLSKAQVDRARELQLYDEYYRGKHRLAFATEKFRKTFGAVFSAFADNWCDLVVDAVEERLNVQGFRIPGGSDEPGETEGAEALEEATTGDDDAWRIWQENYLDAESQIAHTEALISKEAYALVWNGDVGTPLDGKAQITIEHPTQMICETAGAGGGYRRRVRAAMKRWLDDSGLVFLTIYLPDDVWKFQSDRKVSSSGTLAKDAKWVERAGLPSDEAWPMANPLEVVPVVPFYNKPRLLVPAQSEIRQVIPVQDAVNKLCMDLVIASEFQSFRQRWVTGLELEEDPETHQLIEPFKGKGGIERMLTAEDPNATFGEFGQTDLTKLVAAIEMFVQHIASQTRTPPHYFFLRGQMPSGETIKSAETGLVAKTTRKMVFFGEAWEEVIRLAFKVVNDKRSAVYTSETIWKDPESRSEAQHADAVAKMLALGVPKEALWEELGFTPQQISRFKIMREEEAKLAALAAPTLALPSYIDPATGEMVTTRNPNARKEITAGTSEPPDAAGGAGGAG